VKVIFLSVLILIISILLLACSDEDSPGKPVREERHPGLTSPALVKETAPSVFAVQFESTKGTFLVECDREWAPNGVDRFYNLVKIGYLNDIAFYRALESYIVQFGTHSDPEVTQAWSVAYIGDDPVVMPNQRGYLTFAQDAPNTRTTQLFFNLTDNSEELDPYGLAPICTVTEGTEILDLIYTGYGEMHPEGEGPRPNLLQKLGNKYLKREFPEMDYILRTFLVE